MPKNKKKAESSSDDSDSGPDDRTPAKKPKNDKPAPAATSKKVEGGGDQEDRWSLDTMRFVSIREFRGRQNIDIREYYEKDGKILPGKKGIALTPIQWRKLLEVAEEINAAL